jgi:hypothetical protein
MKKKRPTTAKAAKPINKLTEKALDMETGGVENGESGNSSSLQNPFEGDDVFGNKGVSKKPDLKPEEDEDDEDYDDFDDEDKAEGQQFQKGNEEEEEEGELLNEEDMLDIAEHTLLRIANELKQQGVSVRELFDEFIAEAVIDGEPIEVLTQIGFFEGLAALDMEFSEIEIECVLGVLCKPQLENCLLVDELVKIMENFEIFEDEMGRLITKEEAEKFKLTGGEPGRVGGTEIVHEESDDAE